MADHDDDEGDEEEKQQKVELPLLKPHQRFRCYLCQRRMKEEERPESGPIVMMVKIMK